MIAYEVKLGEIEEETFITMLSCMQLEYDWGKLKGEMADNDVMRRIEYRGETVGLVCYNKYHGVIHLIEVEERHRNEGIASRVIAELFKESGAVLYGFAQPESLSFWLRKGGYVEGKDISELYAKQVEGDNVAFKLLWEDFKARNRGI